MADEEDDEDEDLGDESVFFLYEVRQYAHVEADTLTMKIPPTRSVEPRPNCLLQS